MFLKSGLLLKILSFENKILLLFQNAFGFRLKDFFLRLKTVSAIQRERNLFLLWRDLQTVKKELGHKKVSRFHKRRFLRMKKCHLQRRQKKFLLRLMKCRESHVVKVSVRSKTALLCRAEELRCRSVKSKLFLRFRFRDCRFFERSFFESEGVLRFLLQSIPLRSRFCCSAGCQFQFVCRKVQNACAVYKSLLDLFLRFFLLQNLKS